jgi:hypothetical protein
MLSGTGAAVCTTFTIERAITCDITNTILEVSVKIFKPLDKCADLLEHF